MPCRSDGAAESDNARLASELDCVTRFACEAMTLLERASGVNDLSAEARAWWEKHKKFDQRRRDEEVARIKALKELWDAYYSLTTYQRSVLGVRMPNETVAELKKRLGIT